MAVKFNTQNGIFQNLRSYVIGATALLTDFNIGSVLNSLLYAFSNGLASIYTTLQNIYEATFVAKATGDDLDERVLDFNLQRRLATRGSGEITFFRTSPSGGDVIVPAGTRVKTITTNLLQGLEFQTTIEKVILPSNIEEQHTFYTAQSAYNFDARKVYDITSVTGTVSGFIGYTFVKDTDYSLNASDETQAQLEWSAYGASPDDRTSFAVTYQPLSIDVPIQASAAGAAGNVGQGTIVNMPTTPAGVEELINYDATSGGTDAETDDDLRARVPLYLSSLSKGTKAAIKAAALSVDGVQSASVVEFDPPNGFVTVFIDDGTGGATSDMIRRVKDDLDGTVNGVEATSATGVRAAGISVVVTSPTVKNMTITLLIYVEQGFDPDIVSSNIEVEVSQWLTGFGTGQDVYRAEVIDTVMNVAGVLNIDLSQLLINGTSSGDVAVGSSEVARLFSITIVTR